MTDDTAAAGGGGTARAGTAAPEGVIEQAGRLAAILEAENAALAATDYRHAERFAREKQTAVAALMLLRDAGTAVPANRAAALRAAGERLSRLLDVNTHALQQAIAVQGQVIDTLARATVAVRGRAPQGYGAKGTYAAPRMQGPVAFVSRA